MDRVQERTDQNTQLEIRDQLRSATVGVPRRRHTSSRPCVKAKGAALPAIDIETTPRALRRSALQVMVALSRRLHTRLVSAPHAA